MKIIYNNIIPFRGFFVVNLFGILFVRKNVTLSEVLLNHEKIHTAQMKELWYIGFYLLYILMWFKNLLIYKSNHEAYRNIAFEKEAYNNEDDPVYLVFRKKFAWKRK